MEILNRQSLIALVYFVVIALLGVTLRLFAHFEIPANYRFVVHTHSHIALLGWVYTALISLLYLIFLKERQLLKKYRIIFWSTQICIIGMMVTFPFTGYALFSITFSSLFLFASYWFTFFFLKNANFKNSQAYKLIRISLWYMVISSIGPWALGIIMNTEGSGSAWYRNAVYFYLHFQYNGWFIVALAGLFLYVLNQKGFVFSTAKFRYFFLLLNSGVILTFFLSLLWMKPHWSIYLLALFGGIAQLVAFAILFREIYSRAFSKYSSFSKVFRLAIGFAGIFLLVKLIAQIFGAFPAIANIVFFNIDFIISYIHWVFLGIVSLLILGFLNYFNLVKLSGFNIFLYLAGFLLTEVFIFLRGLDALVNYINLDLSSAITLASILLFIAVLAILLGNLKSSTKGQE